MAAQPTDLDGVTPEDLTPADRELAQLALLRIYLGRLKRAQWRPDADR